MAKCHRMSTAEVYTIGFVPSYLLPDRRPNAMDPFLEISDLENSFIEGNLAFVLCSFSFEKCLCRYYIFTDTIKLMDGYEKLMEKCLFLQQI